jgi:hypothetical protein
MYTSGPTLGPLAMHIIFKTSIDKEATIDWNAAWVVLVKTKVHRATQDCVGTLVEILAQNGLMTTTCPPNHI